MRDIGPEDPVVVVEVECRAEALALNVEPDFAQALDRKLALAALGMDPCLELVEGDLPHHGVEHVLDLVGKEDLPRRLVGRGVEHRAEGQHFAEHRGGLGQRQRRVGEQRALHRGEALVAAVAKLVGERHHVARATHVVEHQVGVRARYGGMRERARGLARTHRNVDPGLLEERLGGFGELGREAVVGVQHQVYGVGPGIAAAIVAGERRVAVGVGELFQPQPLRLQSVIAVRQARIGRLHRRNQGVDDFVLDLVGEVAARHRPLVAAPVVVDLLVLGQHVGDERGVARVVAQHLGDHLARVGAHLAVRVGELVERLGHGQLGAVEGEAHRREGFVEQAIPRRATDDLPFMQEIFRLVGKLVGAEGADVVDPGLIAPGVGMFEPERDARIVDVVEFEAEEQRLLADHRRLLVDVLLETGDGGIGHGGGMAELGEAQNPAEDLVDLLILAQRLGKTGGVQRRHLAGEVPREFGRQTLDPLEIGLQLRALRAGVEIGEIPGRKRRRRLRGGSGHGNPS